jgi:tetratricopeptide (TPR) repeat protein
VRDAILLTILSGKRSIALRWINELKNLPVSDLDPGPDFLQGVAYCELGDPDRAFEHFQCSFTISKGISFLDEDPKYLAFYREHATNGKCMDLPSNVNKQIDLLSEMGNDLADQGEFSQAAERWKQALELLPAPQANWEAYTWLKASIGDALYQLADFSAAREALFDALNGPDGQENPFVHYRLGQSELALKNEEAGIAELLKAYMLDGEEIFTEEEDGHIFLQKLRDAGLAS